MEALTPEENDQMLGGNRRLSQNHFEQHVTIETSIQLRGLSEKENTTNIFNKLIHILISYGINKISVILNNMERHSISYHQIKNQL